MSLSRATPAAATGGATASPEPSVDRAALRANKLDLVEHLADDLAHEIKNPLHSMVVNLEVLRRRIARSGREDEGELARYAGVLATELERVYERVETPLQLVRVPRGAEPTTLAGAVADLHPLVELERERRGVEVEYFPPVFTGRGHLAAGIARQLVLNVLVAGLEAVRGGGRLEIRTIAEEGRELLLIAGRPNAGAPPERVPREVDDDDYLVAASALAEQVDGCVEVRAAEGGFEFRVSLPTPAR